MVAPGLMGRGWLAEEEEEVKVEVEMADMVAEAGFNVGLEVDIGQVRLVVVSSCKARLGCVVESLHRAKQRL